MHTQTIVFGRPKPLDPESPRDLRAAFRFTTSAAAARKLIKTNVSGACRDIIIQDMAKVLDEGRITRGFAEIYDLKRAGYQDEVAAALGPEAAKIMARRAAARGVREPFEETACEETA